VASKWNSRESVTITSRKGSPGRTADTKHYSPRVALTIAGLDPSGGAGIIADVRTFHAMGVYPMAVACSLTYQSTKGLLGRYDLPPEVVERQIETLLPDRKPDALKTGVLGRADTVKEVARLYRKHSLARLVVDPVAASGDGKQLLEAEGFQALVERLLPLATLVVPNLEETSLICGFDVFDVNDMKAAALFIKRMGAGAVLVTGARVEERGRQVAADVFFDGHGYRVMTSLWIEGDRVHGTGCVLSAAITASIALGRDLESAVVRGRNFVRKAMERAVKPGTGVPCADPWAARRGAGGEKRRGKE
jgi:hydroxymethylpyrimidine kinase/phosphomethylpyrimidine kinase